MPSSFTGDPTSYPTTYLIPSDGDDRDAASVNVAFEALGDRTEWLRARMNERFEYGNDSNSGGDPSLVESFAYNTIGTTWTKSSVILVNVASCVAFDTLQCELKLGMISMNNAASLASLRMFAIDDVSGTPNQSAVLYSHVGVASEGTAQTWPIYTRGRHVIAFNGTCRIGLEVRLRTATAGFSLDVYSGIHLYVQRIKL